MQDYIALRIDAVPCLEDITDLLAAFLCDEGFESFKPDDCGLTAYVRTDLYDEGAVKKILEEFPIDTDFTFSSGTVTTNVWFIPLSIKMCLLRNMT